MGLFESLSFRVELSPNEKTDGSSGSWDLQVLS